MARVDRPQAPQIYDAAQRFIDAGLRQDGSLFAPGRTIWSLPNIEALHKRLIQGRDNSGENFMAKLQRQLEGANGDVVLFTAELLFIHVMPIREKMGGRAKRDLIRTVLSWLPEPLAVPAELDAILDHGLVNVGAVFLTERPRQLELLLEFLRRWKQLSEDERSQLLSDPWAFKALVRPIKVKAAEPQKSMLLHIVHPDTFEPIVSGEHRRRIAQHFKALTDGASDDIDRQLEQIRRELEARHGKNFSFYSAPLKREWDRLKGDWETFVRWAKRFYESPDYDLARVERDYKLQVAANLAKARHAVIQGDAGWLPLLKKAFEKPNNLTPWQLSDNFLKWCEGTPEAARNALYDLWTHVDPVNAGISNLVGAVPKEAHEGMVTALASFLLMGIDGCQYPIYRRTPFTKGMQLTGYPPAPKGSGPAELYRHALEFLDRLLDEARKGGLDLVDRLDAQGILWAVTRDQPRGSWSTEERDAFLAYRGEVSGYDDESAEVEGSGNPGRQHNAHHAETDRGQQDDARRETLHELASRLFLLPSFLEDATELLRDRKQIIFYGPPGTGKTFVARELARHLAGSPDRVTVVQFHPSYSYEDFVEGFRPEPDGKAGFALVERPLKRLARAAEKAPNEQPFILLIDELNRGNIARIFGELFFLLEYRNEELTLQYSQAPFKLPNNLWIIGTMNTADRSIALLDAALRRRFYFVPFFPDQPPVEGLLRRWLDHHRPELAWVADLLDLVNRQLEQRHSAIGPSHFMKKNLDEQWVARIWKHSVLPYIEELHFGEKGDLEHFSLEALRERLGRPER